MPRNHFRDFFQLHIFLKAQCEHLAMDRRQLVNRGRQPGAAFEIQQPFQCVRIARPQPFTRRFAGIVRRIQALGVPVIYFGVDTASLLPTMRQTGADVIGLDWRVDLAQAWGRLGDEVGVQGNLDPVALFAPIPEIERQVKRILDRAAGRPGHIFNLGHVILPHTPVDHVLALVDMVHSYSGSPAR